VTVYADQLIEAAWKYDPDVSSLDDLRALLLESAATLLRHPNLTGEGVSAVVGVADSDRPTAEGNVSRSASPTSDLAHQRSRPPGSVDVHIEQMDNRCWWIGLHRPDGTYWHGNFTADSRGRMRFSQQENNGVEFYDHTHERTT